MTPETVRRPGRPRDPDLEARLRARVKKVEVTSVDYVRDLMVVDVRFQVPRSAPSPARERSGGLPLQTWTAGR